MERNDEKMALPCIKQFQKAGVNKMVWKRQKNKYINGGLFTEAILYFNST